MDEQEEQTEPRTTIALAFTDDAAASFAAMVDNLEETPFEDSVNAARLREKMEVGSIERLAERSVALPVETAEYGRVRLIVREGVVFAFTDKGPDTNGAHQILVVAVFALVSSQPTAALYG
jgi:hypothetical protein